MKRIVVFILLLFVTEITQAQVYQAVYGAIVNQCSQQNITNNLTTFESLGLKRKGTTALQNTLDWLKNKYISFGYTTSQIEEQSYTYSGYTCKNLIVTKTGTLYPNIYVIVCGHYDSTGGTGTNDNGSGVVSILEVARLLQSVPTEYSIKFINFSGEEDGLYGSQNFVSQIVNGTSPKMNIRIVFNLDEVGGVAGVTNNQITCEKDTNNTPSTNNAQSATFTNELMNCVSLYSPLTPVLSYAYSSDYMPFQANNEIITGFFETNETTHKHTATDLLINMDPVYNFNVAKAAIGATLHFAKASTTLSIDSKSKEDLFTIENNPVKDFLKVNYSDASLFSNATITIVDIMGNVVTLQKLNQALVSVENLPVGLYLLSIYNEKGELLGSKKIIKE